MPLKNLSTEAMVSVSAAWVDPKQDRPLLERFKMLQPLIPVIEKTHRNLLKTQVNVASGSSELAEIQSEETRVDALHDRKLRGTYNLLTGLADLAENAVDAQAYLDLRDRLFPGGLQMTKATYAAEAGAVEMVKDRLTPADRKLAKAIPVFKGKLHDQIDTWIEAGKRLGALEQKKSRVAAPAGPSKSDAASMRNAWIKGANALETTAGLEDGFDDAVHQKIFGLMERLLAASERRKGSSEGDGSGGGESTSGDSSPSASGDDKPDTKKS